MKLLIFIVLIFCIASCNCSSDEKRENLLVFKINQEKNVYEQSVYKKPPQFAIWLQNLETGEIKTVFVTYCTASGDFGGKTKRPVSLPAWIGAFRKETGRNDIPTRKDPANDAITGATPWINEISIQTEIPKRTKWNYFVEVNVSGDYTEGFPQTHSDGSVDSQGNGQPSIIYRGEITSKPGEKSTPELIGRTEQLFMSIVINPDLNGIDSAQKLFSNIEVVCQEITLNDFKSTN